MINYSFIIVITYSLCYFYSFLDIVKLPDSDELSDHNNYTLSLLLLLIHYAIKLSIIHSFYDIVKLPNSDDLNN